MTENRAERPHRSRDDGNLASPAPGLDVGAVREPPNEANQGHNEAMLAQCLRVTGVPNETTRPRFQPRG